MVIKSQKKTPKVLSKFSNHQCSEPEEDEDDDYISEPDF